MKARLYLNRMDLSQFIDLDIAAGMTLHDWVVSEAPDYQERTRQPISIWVNGQQVQVDDWPSRQLADADVVEVYAEPGGPAVVWAIVAVVVSAVVAYTMMPDVPKVGDQRQGSSISDANVQGNRPRLGGVEPEIAGRHRYFPDHISTPRRYYLDNKQYLDLMVSVCRGHCDLPPERIFIANSSLVRWAGDVSYQIFAPGAAVTTHPAHRNWYVCPEVEQFEIKGSAVGEFEAVTGVRSIVTGRDVDGSYIVIREDGISIDPGWAIGIRLALSGAVVEERLYEGVVSVIDAGVDDDHDPLPDILRAPYGWSSLGPVREIKLVSEGPLAGSYRVRSVAGTDVTLESLEGVPLTGAAPATAVLVRIYEITTVDGLYDVVGRDLDMAYVAKVGAPEWEGFSEAEYDTALIEVVLGGTPANEYGPYAACPPGVKTPRVALNFSRPQGWGYYSGSGKFRWLDVECEIWWRDLTVGGDWTVITKMFSGRTVDELGETMQVEFPTAIEPEIKFVRVTPSAGSNKVIDHLYWNGLHAELPSASAYEHETTMAMTILGSNALSGSAESKLSVEPTRKLQVPLASGVWSDDLVATRDIAPFFRYVLLDAGYTDAEINQAELWRLHQLWASRGDKLDGVIDQSSTLYEALRTVLAPGYAEPTQAGGLWTPVRDAAITWADVQNQFGPMAHKLDSFEMSDTLVEPDDNDGVEVEYIDPVSWKPATVMCLWPGQAGIRPLQLKAFGMTSRLHAWRWGMRENGKKFLRRRSMKWVTDPAGLNVGYMEPISVADAEPEMGSFGEVWGWDAGTLTLTLSAPLLVDSDEAEQVIALRRPDGTQYGPVPVTPVGPVSYHTDYQDDLAPQAPRPGYHQVRLPAAPDFTVILPGHHELEATHWLGGVLERHAYLGLVKKATPQGTSRVAMEAWAYVDEVYRYDDAPLPEGL